MNKINKKTIIVVFILLSLVLLINHKKEAVGDNCVSIGGHCNPRGCPIGESSASGSQNDCGYLQVCCLGCEIDESLWWPTANQYCNDELITQTSNCHTERQVYGTMDCANSVCSDAGGRCKSRGCPVGETALSYEFNDCEGYMQVCCKSTGNNGNNGETTEVSSCIPYIQECKEGADCTKATGSESNCELSILAWIGIAFIGALFLLAAL